MTNLIGSVAVDSGQIMIVDPCYIQSDFANNFSPATKGQDNTDHEMNYDGCCNASLSKNGYGTIGNLGLACSTLYGDGEYPVYATFDDDGRVKTLTIDFDPVPESETCYHCGEDLYNNECDCFEDEEDNYDYGDEEGV